MKNHSFIKAVNCLFTLLAICLFAGCKDKAKNLSPLGEESYYWTTDEKIPVRKYYGTVTLRHTEGMTEAGISTLIGIKSSDLAAVSRIHDKIWRIEFKKGKIPSALPIHVMPSLMVADLKDVSMLTGEISIKIRSETNLGAIVDKYGLSLVREPKSAYGSYLFAVPVPSQTLEIANKIQEEENVEWSVPDMIAPIQLF